MSTNDFLRQYDEMDDNSVAGHSVSERIPQRSYSPRHERRRVKGAPTHGLHRRRVKR